MLKGQDDIRLVQLGLAEAGIDVRVDGVFGKGSSNVVISLQRQRRGLPQTGSADAATVLRMAEK
jgi:peptidoglycan hydrolase-like protein with peptidoglycan-binding domain